MKNLLLANNSYFLIFSLLFLFFSCKNEGQSPFSFPSNESQTQNPPTETPTPIIKDPVAPNVKTGSFDPLPDPDYLSTSIPFPDFLTHTGKILIVQDSSILQSIDYAELKEAGFDMSLMSHQENFVYELLGVTSPVVQKPVIKKYRDLLFIPYILRTNLNLSKPFCLVPGDFSKALNQDLDVRNVIRKNVNILDDKNRTLEFSYLNIWVKKYEPAHLSNSVSSFFCFDSDPFAALDPFIGSSIDEFNFLLNKFESMNLLSGIIFPYSSFCISGSTDDKCVKINFSETVHKLILGDFKERGITQINFRHILGYLKFHTEEVMQEWIMAKFEKEMASAPQKAVSSLRNCHIISQSSIFGRVYNILKLKVNLIKIIEVPSFNESGKERPGKWHFRNMDISYTYTKGTSSIGTGPSTSIDDDNDIRNIRSYSYSKQREGSVRDFELYVFKPEIDISDSSRIGKIMQSLPENSRNFGVIIRMKNGDEILASCE